MTTDDDLSTSETSRRPFAYWLRVVDDLIGDELTRAFAEGDRRAPGDDPASLRARIHDAVSSEDLATTSASLEAIARALGWDDDSRPLRGGPRRGGFGPGPRFGHAFGHGFGRSHRAGHADGHRDEHRHGHHHGGGCGEHGHGAHRSRSDAAETAS